MRKIIGILLIVLTLGLVACAGGNVTYKDGSYRAEYSAFDSRGWKPYLEVVVSGGKISEARFDYVNATGALKSQDAAYNSRMEASSGNNVTKFVVDAGAALVAKQNAPIDTITGATSSTANFNELAQVLLAKAKTGDKSLSIIPLDGTYVAEAEPDSRGYIGRVELTFAGDKIVNAVYDEVQKAENGSINYRKSEDAAYGERWGKEVAEVYKTLTDSLLRTQDPAQVDAVSGATSAQTKFVELSNKVLDSRGR